MAELRKKYINTKTGFTSYFTATQMANMSKRIKKHPWREVGADGSAGAPAAETIIVPEEILRAKKALTEKLKTAGPEAGTLDEQILGPTAKKNAEPAASEKEKTEGKEPAKKTTTKRQHPKRKNK